MLHYRDFSWERWAGTIDEQCRVSVAYRSYVGASMWLTLPEWKVKGGKRVYGVIRTGIREGELAWLFGLAFGKRARTKTGERFLLTYVRPVTLLPRRTTRYVAPA